ncbi:NADP-dependent oxidoreductase [Actinacidiphila acidipaludis]|uniref:NADP-dependent oxidoreductase n=1 Tax=Actinacidiphila acidipaludis TaxID=2873382 RepID=A0ABS7QEN4_9ACTN|nr:NADP-dependent oxidoreductase [Streptomyces acidipaludis]MBY8881635.1 NADP-dependent oxidoreductase [Streptomyces acidipaludis]
MPKAIAFAEFGSPDVLRVQERDVPQPGPGQVRIAVRVAGVNALDHKIRSGQMNQVFPVSLPHVPGVEAAGVIESLGEGVEGLTVGEAVFGQTATGAYAELALADAGRIAIKPDTVGWEQAAAIPVAAETTYRALELLRVQPGETLLVHAAAGAVGGVAVQVAVARGLTVIGTASEANHDHLRALGAIPVTYGDGLVERVRAVAPQGVDAALDAAGRGGAVAASVELTGNKDRVVTIADGQGAAEYGVRFTSGGGDEYRGEPAFQEALALVAAGKLELPVFRAFPLAEAAEAHRLSEGGHVTGKIVLTV